MKKDGFGHESPIEGQTNDWITPYWLIKTFNDTVPREHFFSLDPCASLTQPWSCASRSFTAEVNGLLQSWAGVIWLNPPYGSHAAVWIRRLVEHGNGVALVFARTETRLWQDHIFPTAASFLFLRRRISFSRPDGTTPRSSSGAPSVLIAWGEYCSQRLKLLAAQGILPGAFLIRPENK